MQLPESDDATTERLVAGSGARRADPPAEVQGIIDQLIAHLSGAPQVFHGVRLDLSGATPFYRRVYEAAQAIPSGQVRSYSDLAAAVGEAGAARAVGQALARNPLPILVPCHRILTRDGKTGGFSAFGGATTKVALLSLEGVRVGRPSEVAVVTSLFDGDCLGQAVVALEAKDERLTALLRTVGPCTLSAERPESPFAALVDSIIYQQLAGKAAEAIVRRFEGVYGGFPDAEEVLQTPDEVLRAAGLSSSKIVAIQTLAQAVASGSLPLAELIHKPDAEVRTALTALKGIGPWTVDMFLIFHLGRPDVFPTGDLGIRKAIQKLYRLRQLPEPARMEKLTTRWKPYRTVATWYLWRSLGVVTLGVQTEVEAVRT
ncbi:MAG TPA: methylated-DNA--[protein]-cysteine S-methyltransferase [Candidatus Xenobia bacterium]